MQQVVDGLLGHAARGGEGVGLGVQPLRPRGPPVSRRRPRGREAAPGSPCAAARAAAKNEWWWFDAMHYRKTGKLARKLLEKTTPGSPLHLYAIGYLTHVSADTVGHPYVNAISGGPYRSHAQRHKASENYQDMFNFLDVRGADWNRSAIHALYNFNFTGPIDTENDVPDPFTHLPNALADAHHRRAERDLRRGSERRRRPDYAKPITARDINDTYRLWYRWFKSATDTGTLPPPVPYSLTAELREVWDQVVDNLDSIGDFLEDAANAAGDLGIWGIFLLLGALILAALAAAAALIDAVLGALTTLGSATIRYAACLIYEQLYNAFETFRLAVAMNGLAFPMLEHLADPRISHFANPALPTRTADNVQSIIGPPARRSAGPGPASCTTSGTSCYPPTSGEQPGRLRGAGQLPRQDVHLVRVGRHPAEGGHPRRAARSSSRASITAQNDDGTLLAGIYDDKNLLGNALDARRGAVRADEGRPRPARLQPRRRPRLRLPLLEPAGRPGARLPGPVFSERRHRRRRRCRSTSSADAGGHARRRIEDGYIAELRKRAARSQAEARKELNPLFDDRQPAARLRRELVPLHPLLRRRRRQPPAPLPGLLALPRPADRPALQPRRADHRAAGRRRVSPDRDRPQPRRSHGSVREGGVLAREPERSASTRALRRSSAWRPDACRPTAPREVSLDYVVPPALSGHRCLFARVFSFSPLDLPIDDFALDPRIDRHVGQLNLYDRRAGDELHLDWIHLANAAERLEVVPMASATRRSLRP